MKHRITRFAAIVALSVSALAAQAQAFPEKPVKIVVPQTPGGASDTLARILAQRLGEKWGQSVVVENKPGAGGNLGIESAANAPAMQDLMGGNIQIVFTSLPSVAGHIRQGALHPIAVTSAKRSASFAAIPTIAEAGFRDFDVNPWFGLFAPAKAPPQVVAKINADVNELLGTKDVQDRFMAAGAETYVTTPQEFARVLKADIDKWGRVVKASGATVDWTASRASPPRVSA